MPTRRALAVMTAATVALAGCGGGGGGGGSSATVPGGADPSDLAVIEGWAKALAGGDVGTAAAYFALPSVAENGPVVFHITTRGQARAFNASLPCGARVIRAVSAGRFTTATFRLGERPGPGSCGAGSGATARTAFVIRDGKIVQWRRVGAGSPAPRPPSPSV